MVSSVGMDTVYDKRMREMFDVSAIRQAYLRAGAFTVDQFDELLDATLRIRAMEIPDLTWTLFDHIVSVCRRTPLHTHYEALSAGLHWPFRGVQGFLVDCIEHELLPPRVLNQTLFFRAPPPQRIGDLMKVTGLLSEQEIETSVRVQMRIARETGIGAALGQIFFHIGHVSIVDIYQVLGIQVGVPFETLDRSAAAIFAAAMHRVPGSSPR